MGETVEEIQQPVSPTMAGQSDSEESTESTLGLGPGLSGMDLSGDAEGRGGDPRAARRVGSEGESQENAEGEFSCRWGTCNESFSHVDLLASHVTCIHATSGEGGLYYCGWRGCSRGRRGFNARYKMLIHVRTHTNEKPHRCPRCDKSFSRAENLKIHARSHTGERPYVCPVPGCGKAYSNSSDRFKHTRTHSVERPYACRVPGCSKRYTDPSSLRKHVKTYAHYHRPGMENNSKVEEQHNETNLIEQAQDKNLPISRVNGKVNDTGKSKIGNTLLDKETRRSSRNSRTQALKDVKMNSSAKVTMDYQENRLLATKDELRVAAMETDPNKEGSLQNEFGSRNNKLSEHGRIQVQHMEDCSPTSWDTIPDDKWLENDIEEVEEDEEEEMNREEFQNQEHLGMKETSYLSGDVIHDQSRHSKMVLDAEWSSGGEEGWMSDESDCMQNGMHNVTSLSTAYVDFSNKTVKSSHRPYYLAEQQMISKLNKKNYILSRSCQKRLDDLLLRSLPKFGSSNLVGAKKHHYQVDAFQERSPATIGHQSRMGYKGLGKYKKAFNNMAYNSVPYEQVVPLDLRKINE